MEGGWTGRSERVATSEAMAAAVSIRSVGCAAWVVERFAMIYRSADCGNGFVLSGSSRNRDGTKDYQS